MKERDIVIVLQVSAYNDKYSIVQAYSRLHGRVAFMLPLRSSRGGLRRSLFSPFNIVETEGEYREAREVQRVTEARAFVLLEHIHFDAVKLSLALFLAEVVIRSVREREANVPLFDFLAHAIQLLDKMEEGAANFHLCFMIQLSAYLGFYPNMDNYQRGDCFDLESGTFVTNGAKHGQRLSARESANFVQLMRMNFNNLHRFRYSRDERNAIVDAMAHYYKVHVAGFGDMRSLDVLKTLFV